MEAKGLSQSLSSTALINPSLLSIDQAKKLGEGGFGVVYRGKYRGLDAAIKQLKAHEFSPKVQHEFYAEAQVMLQLRDPSVVHLYGITQNPYRMVMEFCWLGSLTHYLQNPHSEIRWPVRFHLGTGIASGLHYLHTFKPLIIHGDLKSLNVLLVGDREYPNPKLADFGLSRVKTESQSKSKHSGGIAQGLTVHWAAPELFSLKPKTTASDMYAFAMTLWEIASRTYPYEGFDQDLIRSAVKEGTRAEIPEGTPESFSQIIQACWVQDPKTRLTAEQALQALQLAAEKEVTASKVAQVSTAMAQVSLTSGFVDSLGYLKGGVGQPTSQSPSVVPVYPTGFVNSLNTPLSQTQLTPSSLGQARLPETVPEHPKEDKINRLKGVFFQAIQEGDQDKLNKLSAYIGLLSDGFMTQDAEGNTALHLAAAKGQVEIVRWLIQEHKMDVGVRNRRKETPLLLAAKGGQQAVIECLITFDGIDVGERDIQGATMLLIAANASHLSLVAWLLETGLSRLPEKDKQQNTIFTSKVEAIVLWAMCYREVNESPDRDRSEAFEKIAAYSGKDALNLQWVTVKTLLHSGAKGLLKRYEGKLEAWWSGWTEMRQSELKELAASRQLEGCLPWVAKSQPRTFSVTPSVFQPAPPKTVAAAEQVERMSAVTKEQNKIRQEDLQALLKWVTEGHLVEVEQLLKKNPSLGVCTGTVTDLSDRAFKNITGLQYAAWCLDEEMCDLLMRYIGAHNSAIQLKALYSEPDRYSTYGNHYDITLLIEKTQIYVKNCENWRQTNQIEHKRYWQKEVGGEQRKCPAWLIYAWSENGYDVAWVKQDFNRPIKREYDRRWLDWWFTENYNNGRGVGSCMAVERGLVGEPVVAEVIIKTHTWAVQEDLKNQEKLGIRCAEFLQKLKNLSINLNTLEAVAIHGKKQ